MERVEVLTKLIWGGDFFAKKRGGNNIGGCYFFIRLKMKKKTATAGLEVGDPLTLNLYNKVIPL